MATKQELFDVLLSFRIDMTKPEGEPESPFDDYYKVLIHMLGLESELAALLHVPRWEVEQSTRRAYEKYKAEYKADEVALERKRKGGNPGHSNPGHHSGNLKKSAIAGVTTGGVVFGVAKWKEDWVRQNLHTKPEYLGVLGGAAGFGLSYFVL